VGITFTWQVYDKNPEEFKIRCLKDIQSLYPGGKNPFFAGYGNKPNVRTPRCVTSLFQSWPHEKYLLDKARKLPN
jgi:hypothetical protein